MKKSSQISKIAFFCIAFLTLVGCSPQFSSVWKQPDYQKTSFSKVIVFGITDNLEGRTRYERAMVQVLSENGVSAVASLDFFENPKEPSQLSENQIEKRLRDNGIDGVFTAAVVDVQVEEVYNSGATYTTPVYGRTFRGYYYRTYARVQEPGYYSQYTNYLIENNVYNLNSGGLIWTAQSKESSPGNPEKFSVKYSTRVVEQLKADGIL